jgi:hypothetical protein
MSWFSQYLTQEMLNLDSGILIPILGLTNTYPSSMIKANVGRVSDLQC